jgi:hypothetical protein
MRTEQLRMLVVYVVGAASSLEKKDARTSTPLVFV